MTSKNSFSNMIKTCIRRRIWSLALAFIGFFFAFPIYGAIFISSKLKQVSWGYMKYIVAVNAIRRGFLGEENYMAIGVMMVVAVLLAVSGFSYLFSRQKVDLYFGIPIKRRTLFLADYLSGVICYLMAYVPFMIIGLIVAAGNHVLDGKGILSALIMLLFNLLGFIGIYTISIIAVLLTGNLPVCLLAVGTLMTYVPLVWTLIEGYMSRFFLTYTSYQQYDRMLDFSPVSAYIKLLSGINCYSFSIKPSIPFLIGFLVFLAVSFAVSLVLFEKRPAEASGRALAYKKTMPYISILILIPLVLFGGFGFEELTRNGVRVDYFWLILGSVIALVLGHFVLQAIFYQDFRSLTKNLKNPAIAAGVSAVVMLIFVFDLFGYDDFFPSSGKFESASISCYSLSSGQEYFDFTVEENEYGNHDVWIDTDTYRLGHMKLKDRDMIQKLFTAALEDTREEREIALLDSNDAYNGHIFSYVTVKYTLKNGKEVYRQYTIDFNRNKDIFSPIYETAEYKESVFQILTLTDDEIKNVTYYDHTGEQKNTLSDAQQKNLIHTYQEELRAQKAESTYNEIPIGYLCENVRLSDNNYYNSYIAYKGYVYPSFTKTLSLLKEYGYDVNKWLDASKIKNITVENYQPTQSDYGTTYDYATDAAYVDSNASSILMNYEQKAEIEKILGASYPTEFFSVDGCFHKMQESLDIRVYYTESPNEYMDYSIFWFEEGKTPQFVLDDVQYVVK